MSIDHVVLLISHWLMHVPSFDCFLPIVNFLCIILYASEFAPKCNQNAPLKEADLLDATACLYKLGTDKACHRWSFMLKRERTAKSYLTLNQGFKEVATSFGIMKFSTKMSIHRHMKEPQFPNGRIFVCNT